MNRLILDLGSGKYPQEFKGERVIHLDISEDAPHVEIICDLNHGIPFPSNIFDVVIAFDVLEHLKCGLVAIMDEIHRVLYPGGEAYIRVPVYGGLNHIIDPTHIRGFHLKSFDFFDSTTDFGGIHHGDLYTKRRWSIHNRTIEGGTDGNILIQLEALKPNEYRKDWKPW